MGINNVTYQAIEAAMKLVEEGMGDQAFRPQVLSLGYPDMLVDRDKLPAVIKCRDDFEQVCAYHGIKPARPIAETYDVFRHKGWELTVTDFKELRNESELGQFFEWDLNKYYGVEYSPTQYENRFDLILDCGTMEHVFTLPSALDFINKHCKVGGYIFHANPMQQQNHGFWSFSPTFYNDLYVPVNGCEVVAQVALNTDDQKTVVQVPPTGRFRLEGEWNILTLVRKIAEVKHLLPPIQTKYKKMLGAA